MEFQHIELGGNPRRDHAEPLFDVQFLEQQLLVGGVGLEVCRKEVSQSGGAGDAVENLRRLVRGAGRELDDPIGLRADGVHQRIDAGPADESIFQQFDLRDGVRLVASDRLDAETSQPVHDDRLVAVRQLEEFKNHACHADLVEVVEPRILHVRIALRDDANEFFRRHDLVEQRLALGPTDIERHYGAGKDDDVTDREDRQCVGDGQKLTIGPDTNGGAGLRSLDDLGLWHVSKC